ncbi:MAG: hypothetical protein C4324_05960 [Blastocatellia bacterium]
MPRRHSIIVGNYPSNFRRPCFLAFGGDRIKAVSSSNTKVWTFDLSGNPHWRIIVIIETAKIQIIKISKVVSTEVAYANKTDYQ